MSTSVSSLLYIVMVFSLGLINTSEESAAEFEVGGKDGWHVPDNNDTSYYTRWAADARFHVGDSLSFVYHNDSVMVVDKYAYYHCNTSNPIYIFRDKTKTLIKLDRPGPFYFISGAPDHCNNGQRLEVDVISNSPPSPSDTPAPAPSSAHSTSTIPIAALLAFAPALAFHC